MVYLRKELTIFIQFIKYKSGIYISAKMNYQIHIVQINTTSSPYYKDAMYFTDGCDDNVEYNYDDNGNMIIDKNKGIASIAYNFLNLPGKISQNKVCLLTSLPPTIRLIISM